MSEIMKLIKENSNLKNKVTAELDPLFNFYNIIKDKAMTDEEIFRTYDVTELIYKAMRDLIINKEPFNAGILGKPGTGKSTVMAQLIKEGNDMMMKSKELFKREDGTIDKKRMKNFNYFNQIVADQNEFVGLVKEELWSCFIGIDEYNRMADTGLNSSIEQVLGATYSDIFAQQHVNRISCAPSVVGDVNTWLILEIFGTNKKQKITKCKVIYRDIINGGRQVIGHANIYVGEILKADWYKRYRAKKFKRMELLQRHGIRKFSELEIAPIVMECYKDLVKIIIGDRKVDPDVVLSTVKQIMREKIYIGSMLAESEMSSEIRNLLGLKHNIEKDKMRIIKEKQKEPDKINKRYIKELENRKQKVEDKLKKSLEYQKKMIKILEEYKTIR